MLKFNNVKLCYKMFVPIYTPTSNYHTGLTLAMIILFDFAILMNVKSGELFFVFYCG